MHKIGDRVVLKYCDSPDNQVIVGKAVTVITAPQTAFSTHWMDVRDDDGNVYSVRGSECISVKKSNRED